MSLTIRSAVPADEPALRALADLDSARPLTGARTLVALAGSHLVAALELPSGRAIADPFTPTTSTVAALRAWATPPHRPDRDRARAALDLLAPLLAGRRRRWAP